MSTRSLTLVFLAFVLVAGALIVALLSGGEGDESMSGPRPTVGAVSAPTLPAPAPGREAVPLAAPLVDARPTDAVAAEPEPYAGRVQGRLIDAAGRAVAGEPVRIALSRDPWHAGRASDGDDGELIGRDVSDAEGRFLLPAAPGALHTLLVAGERWPARKVPFVSTGDDLLLTLEDGLVLEGTVWDAESGLPVPEASLLAIHSGAQVTGAADAQGRFSLGPLPPEDVWVAAYAPGYDIGDQGDVAPGLGPIDLELPPGLDLAGRLIERGTNEPVSGGEVRFSIGSRQPGEIDGAPGWVEHRVEERVVEAGADGRFELGPGPRMGFELEVTAPGYVPLHSDRYRTRRVSSDGEIVLALQRVESWTGSVLDLASGRGVPGVRVAAEVDGRVIASAESAADGGFAVPMDAWDGEGAVFLAARAPDGRGARLKARNGSDGLPQPLLLELVPPLRRDVAVLAGGVPLPGARVGVQSQGSETSEWITDAEGVARVDHALAGPFVTAATLQARHLDRESLPLSVDLTSADASEGPPLVLDLDLGGHLAGLVTDVYGTPIASAHVWVKDGLRAYTDPTGAFRLGPLDDQLAHELHGVAEGHRPGRTEAWVGADTVLTLAPVVTWSGRVLDALTAQPLEGFSGWLESVNFDGTKEKTRRVGGARLRRGPRGSGEFTIELPQPGSFRVRIWARDYLPGASVPFDFNGVGPPPPQDIRLEPAAVLVVTLDELGGGPVPGVTVAVLPVGDDGKPAKQGRKNAATNGSGEARFNLGEGGLFEVTSGPSGVFGERLSAPQGVVTERRYTLPQGGRFEVRVLDERGRGSPGARVRLRSDGQSGVRTARTGRVTRGDGLYVFEGLPPGKYSMAVSRRGYKTAQSEVVIASGRTHAAEVEIEPRAPTPPKPESTGKAVHNLKVLESQGYY